MKRSQTNYRELAGEIIGGKYRLEALVADGGMGFVYRGYHLTTNGRVALKILKASFDARAEERFRTEANVVASLSHPNTVRILDYGHDQDDLYLVMEYLRGNNLADVLQREGPLADGRVVHILLQAASSLSEAHAMGLVHRDVKPSNIMLLQSLGVPDFVKVIDFGLSRLVEGPGHQTVGAVGTPRYMSPEQAAEAPPEPRSDLYSLGCVAYELLTGRLPFAGIDRTSSAVALITAHLHTEPTPIETLYPGVQPDLARLVHWLLAKRPEARPQRATDLVGLLQSIQASLSLVGAPVSVNDLPSLLDAPAHEGAMPRPTIIDSGPVRSPSGSGSGAPSSAPMAFDTTEALSEGVDLSMDASMDLTLEPASFASLDVSAEELFSDSGDDPRGEITAAISRDTGPPPGALAYDHTATLAAGAAASDWNEGPTHVSRRNPLLEPRPDPAPSELPAPVYHPSTPHAGEVVDDDGAPAAPRHAEMATPTPQAAPRPAGGALRWVVVGVVGIVVAGGALGFWLTEPADSPETVTHGSGVPAAVVSSIRYTLVSDPAGADVRLRGERIGTTPATVTFSAGEIAELSLTKAGFVDTPVRVDGAGGPEQRIEIALKPRVTPTAWIRLESTPDGAEVYLGDVMVGRTPLDWRPPVAGSPAELTFEKRGHASATASITPQPATDSPITVKVRLRRSRRAHSSRRRRASQPITRVRPSPPEPPPSSIKAGKADKAEPPPAPVKAEPPPAPVKAEPPPAPVKAEPPPAPVKAEPPPAPVKAEPPAQTDKKQDRPYEKF